MNRNVPAIDLEMVLDWAYCEARVWWQLRAAEALQKEPAERKILSGKMLLAEAVRSALYQGYMEREKNQEANLQELLAVFWKTVLKSAPGQVWKRWGYTKEGRQDLQEPDLELLLEYTCPVFWAN